MRSGPRKAPDDAVRAVHKRYLKGEPLTPLAEELGYKNAGTLQAAFRRLQLPRLGRRGIPAYVRLTDPRAHQAFVLWDAGATAKAAAQSVGLSQTIMTRLLRETGRDGQRWGTQHSSWNGGRGVSKGYVHVYLDPDDPMASMRKSHRGHVMEHRLVMARHLNRPLTQKETVHHLNGVRDDNRIENLQLRIGSHGYGSGWRCADCGSDRLEPTPLK